MVESGFVKSRVLVHHSGAGETRNYSNGVLVSRNPEKFSITGKQYTVSGKHPEWFAIRRQIKKISSRDDPDKDELLQWLRSLDMGGNFYTKRQNYVNSHPIIRVSGGGVGQSLYEYEGPLFARSNQVDANSGLWETGTIRMEDEMLSLYGIGATAIARCAPTRPNYSLITALGEIRNDGIPKILGASFLKVRNAKQAAHAVGNEYLNLEFGWKPLIADIQELCHAVLKSEEILDKYEKASGKYYTRKYAFPDQVSVTTVDQGLGYTPYPALSTYAYTNSTGRRLKTVKTETKTWFSGSFRYNLPYGSDNLSQIRLAASKANHLLGLGITPEVLWNLQPWSWLSDWFFNIGDILTNVSAFGTDDLSLNHGYIMQRKLNEITYEIHGVTFKSGNPGPIAQTFSTETKMRRKASPWGFGVKWSGFSPRQIAILGALGITRATHPD